VNRTGGQRAWNNAGFPIANPAATGGVLCQAIERLSGGDLVCVARSGKVLLEPALSRAEVRALNSAVGHLPHSRVLGAKKPGQPYSWRSKSAVLNAIADRWDVSRPTLLRLCSGWHRRCSWRVALAILRRLTPQEEQRLRVALIPEEVAAVRTAYMKSVGREGRRIGVSRRNVRAPHALQAVAQRHRNAFDRYVNQFGCPHQRAALGHLRVWDWFVAFPALLKLPRRDVEALLRARYAAERVAIEAELRAYRTMIPFAKRPTRGAWARLIAENAPAEPNRPKEEIPKIDPDQARFRAEKARREHPSR